MFKVFFEQSMVKQMAKSYLELLEESLPPPTNKNYEGWKHYGLTAIERGLVLRKIISKFICIDNTRILDVGCGEGGISIAFGRGGKTKVYSIDIEPARVYKSKVRARDEKVKIDFLVADGQNLPFKTGAFDVIICNDVIEHVSKPRQLLKEMYRNLRTGGFLYLCAPNGISIPLIIRDGHYGLFGVSLMPYQIGKYYVTKIRKISEEYDVYGPFNYWLLRGRLGDMFRVVDCYYEQQSRLGKLLKSIPDIILRFVYPTINVVCEKLEAPNAYMVDNC